MTLFGTEEPVPETPVLRAGPLECSLDAGNLRHIKVHGVEAIRAVSYIVRDRNWGTYGPEITNLRIEQDAGGFRVGYDAVCRDAQQAFAYSARIEADASGNLSFAAEGEALSDFVTNRTGFVVLHPVHGVSGAPVEVERVDGSVERSRFPELIDPTCPLMDIRALTHEPLPGVRVACRMEGDTFEMEDQRNWLDASYKTYVRPLALPWPYTIAKGEKLSQRVSLAITGAPRQAVAGSADGVTVTVEDREVAHMPSLGLAVPAEHAEAALGLIEPLRALGPAHLMAAFDARKGHDAGLAQTYGELARALDAELVLEVVLPCVDADGKPTDDLDVLRRDLNYVKGQIERVAVRPARIAVSPACDLKCTLPGSVWPKAPAWADLAAAARAAFPGIAIGGGMFSYFTELNRKRPPAGLFDFLGHSVCPLVHAADDLSLTEGLEALPYIITTTPVVRGRRTLLAVPIGARDAPEPLRRGARREPARRPGGHGQNRPARACADRGRLVCRCPRPCRPRRPRSGDARGRRRSLGRGGRRRPALPGPPRPARPRGPARPAGARRAQQRAARRAGHGRRRRAVAHQPHRQAAAGPLGRQRTRESGTGDRRGEPDATGASGRRRRHRTRCLRRGEARGVGLPQLVDRRELGLEWRPVVALGNGRPERFDLVDQHRAGVGACEVGMIEGARRRFEPRQGLVQRCERLGRVEAGRRAARCRAPRSASPPRQSKKVRSNGAWLRSRKPNSRSISAPSARARRSAGPAAPASLRPRPRWNAGW